MDFLTDLPFNPKRPTILHLDLNSCFATIEQQANPHLRGKPVVVAAYNSPAGCILAASVEAKKLGIKTGLRVKEGKLLCPNLIVLPSDPWKYRYVHLKLRSLLSSYIDIVTPKSIDEFVLDLEKSPAALRLGTIQTAREIKKRIKEEIGDWLTVSIGIAPNRFLAKTASNLDKPDGLREISKDNYLEIYKSLKLTDLGGIKIANSLRLNQMGIYSVLDFYKASPSQLKGAFQSVCAYYWYLRLRGWEVDEIDFSRKSFGNSYALSKPVSAPEEIAPILQRLVEKTGQRMRKGGFKAYGIHLGLIYRDYSFWHQGISLQTPLFDSREIYKALFKILLSCPYRKPVRQIAESVFNLEPRGPFQLELFNDALKKENLIKAVDKINEKWGDFSITSARILEAKNQILDRISFGGVKELEEFVCQ
jgi:DNA polymerase-4